MLPPRCAASSRPRWRAPPAPTARLKRNLPDPRRGRLDRRRERSACAQSSARGAARSRTRPLRAGSAARRDGHDHRSACRSGCPARPAPPDRRPAARRAAPRRCRRDRPTAAPGRRPSHARFPRYQAVRQGLLSSQAAGAPADVGDRHDQDRVGAAGAHRGCRHCPAGPAPGRDIADVDHAQVAIRADLLLRDLEAVDVALDRHGRRRRAAGHARSARSAAASAGSGPRAGRWRSPDHAPPRRSRRSHRPAALDPVDLGRRGRSSQCQ